MSVVTWYFDFISPFAYFGLHTLKQLPAETDVEYRPVLFAGLLQHWGQKGPAEIPPKRVWTYRSCVWWAQRHGVPFRLPAAHPFNPLPYLRLSGTAGNSRQAIELIFRGVWTTGADPNDPRLIESLAGSLGVPLDRLAEPSVKEAIRANTEAAVGKGVFGVPSLLIDDEVFWGSDSVDFAAAYLEDRTVLATEEMRRAATLRVGTRRPGAT